MQTYHNQGGVIRGAGQLVREYVGNLQDNTEALRSNFSGSSAPTDPAIGQKYFNVSNNVTYVYNGTAWIPDGDTTATHAEIVEARGQMNDLKSRLDVSMNPDGTLKDPVTANVDEWKTPTIDVTYVSENSFTVPDDMTPVFTEYRGLKLYDGTNTVFTSVKSSEYSTQYGITTVTTSDSVVSADIETVSYSIIQDSVSNTLNMGVFNHKETFASSGSFTAPVTGTYRITLQGGGGGGSGYMKDSAQGAFSGAGGGQGGHLVVYEKLTAGQVYSFTVGAGGSGGIGSNTTNPGGASNRGGDGGSTSITVADSIYSAGGGHGGQYGIAGQGGASTINGTETIGYGCAGGVAGASRNDVWKSDGGVGGGPGGGVSRQYTTTAFYNHINGYAGAGGAGGSMGQLNGGNGGDGYITFEYCDI